MAWIEIHQTLPRHRKLLALARELNIDRIQAMGHLVAFWLWALDNTPDGSLGSAEPWMIAFGGEWEGNPQIFVDGLQKSGFLDVDSDDLGELYIHDWHDYAGRLIESRQHQASQKRLHRDLYNNKSLLAEVKTRDGDFCRYCHTRVSWTDRKSGQGATYDFVVPFGPLEASNIVVACRACNAGKSNRTPEQAGYILLSPYLQKSIDNIKSKSTTVPYSTPPDTNLNIHTHSWLLTLRSIPGWAEKGEPHLDSLLKWVKAKGVTDDAMECAAIGLSSVQKKTLSGYTNLVSALQRRINNGYDADQKQERANGRVTNPNEAGESRTRGPSAGESGGQQRRVTPSRPGYATDKEWAEYDPYGGLRPTGGD